MAEPLAIRCAAASIDRDEAQHGTASRVHRWLLVEQPGPWGAEAAMESRLDVDVATRLDGAANEHGLRLLLIRRPRRAPGASGSKDAAREDSRRVFLAHSSTERSWLEALDVPAGELGGIADLDLAALAHAEPPGIGEAHPSIHLVCTHGRHDPCCADFGRPVARALTAEGAPEVWESSHLGGDRFAANLVCLPEGIYYGRVAPERAAGIVAGHRAGMIDLDCYRGRSCWPPVVQSAEIFARRHLDERRLDVTKVLDLQVDDGRAVVLIQVDGGPRVEVEAHRVRAEPNLLTCHASGTSRPWQWVEDAVRTV